MGVVEFAELVEGDVSDGTGRVGRAVERRIVADDDVSVARGVDVELNARGAVLERLADRVERARGRLLGTSLVRVGDDAAIQPAVVGHERCLPLMRRAA